MQKNWYRLFFSKKSFSCEKRYFLENWQLAAHLSEISNELHLVWVDGFISLTITDAVLCIYFPRMSKPKKLQSAVVDGFVFVRLSDEKSMDTIKEMTLLREGELFRPLSVVEEKYIDANWKLLVDISLDETHVESIHSEYAGLLGGVYDYLKIGIKRSWKQRLGAGLNECKEVRQYYQLACLMLPVQTRYWEYHWIFPATEIEIYPEQVSYYQIIPISQNRSLKRHRRLGRRSFNPVYWWMRRLNGKIQERIDLQDIDAVLARESVAQSIEEIHLYPGQGDSLVTKFHEIIQL